MRGRVSLKNGEGGDNGACSEIFNIFNRANFDVPNRTFGTAHFGRIFSAKSPREVQFGARLVF